MDIKSTNVVEERGDRFVGISAKVGDAQNLIDSLVLIKNMHPDISTATHNMYAARLVVHGKTIEYCDDDGEYGGGSIILSHERPEHNWPSSCRDT